MKPDTQDLRVSARTARLTAGQDDDDDGPPWTFNGVAVAAGDILHMDDGTRVLMTAEELKKAANSQSGEPLTVDHPADDDGRPQYPPPTDETVGKVPRAGWLDEAEAVGYEATTHDEEIADGVQGGTYEVSVHPQFALGEFREDVQAYVAEDIRFLDLSVVSKGDSPSNTAEWGPNQALASFTAEADIGSQLTAADDVDDLPDDQRGLLQSFIRLLRSADPDEQLSDAPGAESQSIPSSVDADEPSSTETTAAESATDNGSSQQMDDNKRQQYIKFLTANAGFDKDSLESMDDDVLEQTFELAAEATDGDGGSTDDDDDDPTDDKTIADMTPSELGEELREQGFVTEDNADELLAQAQDQISKAEQVDELIAASDDYDEDDREDLMASADALVEKEHERATGGGVSLPAGTGSLTAGAPGTDQDVDEDLDEYGTGQAGQ